MDTITEFITSSWWHAALVWFIGGLAVAFIIAMIVEPTYGNTPFEDGEDLATVLVPAAFWPLFVAVVIPALLIVGVIKGGSTIRRKRKDKARQEQAIAEAQQRAQRDRELETLRLAEQAAQDEINTHNNNAIDYSNQLSWD